MPYILEFYKGKKVKPIKINPRAVWSVGTKKEANFALNWTKHKLNKKNKQYLKNNGIGLKLKRV